MCEKVVEKIIFYMDTGPSEVRPIFVLKSKKKGFFSWVCSIGGFEWIIGFFTVNVL